MDNAPAQPPRRVRRPATHGPGPRSPVRGTLTSLDQLAERLPSLHITEAMRQVVRRYPFAATPYYLSLIEEPSPADPIFRQCIPDPAELVHSGEVGSDELKESSTYAPVRGLIHRYPDRVVALVAATCPMYCRHCTRKRLVGRPQYQPSPAELEGQVEYVRAHPQIKEVILSGGDPLTLSTDRLDEVIAGFRSVPTVQMIRVGTRAPVTLPARVDGDLCTMLERHHPVWVNTQFNHPREVTPGAAAACDRLLRHGIPVGNQAVLLRGVNDSPEIMEDLCRALLRIRVRPYYLFQCDPVAGVEHFRTPVSRGVRIIEHLYRSVGGLGVPRFAVDAADGGGKVPIPPTYVQGCADGRLVLRNFEGKTVTYPDGSTGCSAESAEHPADPRPAGPRRT